MGESTGIPSALSEETEVGEQRSKLVWQREDFLGSIDSTIDAFGTRFREFQERFETVEAREKEMEAKVLNFNSKLEGIEVMVEEKRKAVVVNEKRLREVEELVREKERKCDWIRKSMAEANEKLRLVRACLEEGSKELESKKKGVGRVDRVLNKCSMDVELKRRESEAIKEQSSFSGLLGNIDSTRNGFNTQFREFEDRFVSIRGLLLTWYQELGDQFDSERNSLSTQYRELQNRGVSNIHLEIESKAKEIQVMESLAEEKRKEVEDKESELNRVGKLLEEKSRELEIKEGEVTGVQGVLSAVRRDIELNRKQLNEIRGSVEKEKKMYVSKQDQVKVVAKSLEECEREMKLKKGKLNMIQKSMVECANILESREKIIREMELKMRGFGLLKKSIEEWSSKLESKERELEEWVRKLREAREKHIESTVEELNLIDSKVSECLNHVDSLGVLMKEREELIGSRENSLLAKERQLEEQARELESKQKQFDSLIQKRDKHFQERSHGLEMRERRVQEQAKELELKQKQCDTTQKSMEEQIRYLKSKEKAPDDHLSGNTMQMLDALQVSFDQAKYVLKLMRTYFGERWTEGCVGFGRAFMRNNISMLNDLTIAKLNIGPDLKKDALRLAVLWEAKLRLHTENSLEILGFLQFIATYGLHSTLRADVIVKLLMICQNIQVLELCKTLGVANKIPDFVQILIEKNQLIEAVKYICKFKLTDKFHPVLLLKEYVDDAMKSFSTLLLEKNSLDEKDEVLKNQIADLRAVIQCLKDNNLESEFPSKDIEIRITDLENLRKNWGSSMPTVILKVEQEEENMDGKRSNGNSSYKIEPPQMRRSKRQRAE